MKATCITFHTENGHVLQFYMWFIYKLQMEILSVVLMSDVHVILYTGNRAKTDGHSLNRCVLTKSADCTVSLIEVRTDRHVTTMYMTV